MDNNANVHTKTRVYNWIEYLCTHHNFNQVKYIPVIITRQHVSSKFNISMRQATRILNALVEEKKIYVYKKYNSIFIYSLVPIDINNDIFVRIRV